LTHDDKLVSDQGCNVETDFDAKKGRAKGAIIHARITTKVETGDESRIPSYCKNKVNFAYLAKET
jgi:hypothetical protein